MIALLPDRITKHQTELATLCDTYGVTRLDLFGSAGSEGFDPELSDFDFIVEFADESVGGLADRYLDLAEALERLFGRSVDLLTERAIHNPIFRQVVDRSRQRVYERSAPQIPA